jgi:ribosomal protein S18 acetylase RimI-like enzyme
MTIHEVDKLKPDIRIFELDDIPTALIIEQESFEFPWEDWEFKEYICDDSGIKKAYAARIDSSLVGYVAIEKIKDRQYVRIRNIAVAKPLRRLNVGSLLMDYVYGEFANDAKYDWLVATTRETNLNGQLYFRENQFICKKIINGYYTMGTTEPAYLFKRSLP